MSDSPVLLILGAGPNAGAAIAKTFASKGYKVALAARRADPKNTTSNELHIPVDLSVPTTVVDVFTQVEKTFGFPNVVVYNGSGSAPDNLSKPLGMSLDDFAYNLNINVNSVYAAIHEALKGFEKLPRSVSKTFILTGNALNTTTFFPMLALGAGKAADAHLIEYAARSYATMGYKFYYADQRDEDGSPAWTGIDGEATAKHYLKLSEGKSQGIWQQTFSPEAGYKQFSRFI